MGVVVDVGRTSHREAKEVLAAKACGKNGMDSYPFMGDHPYGQEHGRQTRPAIQNRRNARERRPTASAPVPLASGAVGARPFGRGVDLTTQRSEPDLSRPRSLEA